MTSVACLVTRQMEVSPSKMNIGRSRFAGSSVPVSMFLWAGPTPSVIICFKPKCQTSLLYPLGPQILPGPNHAPTSTKTHTEIQLFSGDLMSPYCISDRQ